MSLHLARQQFSSYQQNRRSCLAAASSSRRITSSWVHTRNGVALAPPRERAVTARRVASEVAEPELSTDKPLDLSPNKDGKIKVSAAGNVRLIAGKIAHSAREGDVPPVVCVGPKCVNMGVKAVAVGRAYLESDGLDLTFAATQRQLGPSNDGKTGLVGVVLQVSKAATKSPEASSAPTDATALNVSGKGQPKLIAGALAARVREGRPVVMTAIGVGAVYKAVLALALADSFVKRDKKAIRAVPGFVKVTKEGREVSAIQLRVLVEDI